MKIIYRIIKTQLFDYQQLRAMLYLSNEFEEQQIKLNLIKLLIFC